MNNDTIPVQLQIKPLFIAYHNRPVPDCCSTLTSFPRRLARRGGVKRIAATIYNDVRQALKDRLRGVGSSLLE
jgi:hypothetical protein